MRNAEWVRRVGREAAWAPLGIVVAHWILGGAFGHEPYVDPAMHFLGGCAVTFFLRHAALRAEERLGRPSALALDLLAFGGACVAAVGWETCEFLSDRLRGTTMQRGLANTMRDLLLGLGGSLLFLVLSRVAAGARRG